MVEEEDGPGAPYPLTSVEAREIDKPKPDCLCHDMPILGREVWGAVPPVSSEPIVVEEVPFVIMTHTRTKTCKTQEQCISIIQNVQKKHMGRGLPDIKYNFLIGGDGQVYEGRGWRNQPAKNMGWPEVVNNCLQFAYIGCYKKPKVPPKHMVKAAWDLLEVGFVKDYVALGVRVLQQRHLPRVYNFHNVQPALGIDYF